jgi:hypothetical protein
MANTDIVEVDDGRDERRNGHAGTLAGSARDG